MNLKYLCSPMISFVVTGDCILQKTWYFHRIRLTFSAMGPFSVSTLLIDCSYWQWFCGNSHC